MRKAKRKWLLWLSVLILWGGGGYAGYKFYLKKQQEVVPLTLTETEVSIESASKSQPIVSPNIKVQEMQTPVGHKVWLVENHHTQVISLSLIFRNAGDKSDPDSKVSRAHLATALFLEGAGPYNNQQLKEKFLEQYLQLSISCEEDEVRIFARFPSENLQAVAELLKFVLILPRFEEEPLGRIRNKLLVSFQQALHNEDVIGQIALAETIYGKHPYGRTIKNALADLPALTLEDIKTYRHERFALDQLEIVAVGDFVAGAFVKTIDTILEGLPAEAKVLDIPTVELQNLGTQKFVELDIPQSQITFVQPGIMRNDPDFIPAVLMNRLLGSGGWKSILWDEVREKGYAYAIDTDLKLYEHAQLLIGDAGTKNQSVHAVIQLIREAWEKMLKSGVSEDKLAFAKEFLTGAFIVGLDSTAHICKILSNLRYLGLEPNYINERNELINNVNIVDMNRVINRLLKPEALTFIVVGNPGAKPS